MEVLSAGQNMQKDAEGKPVSVPVVNLLATPEQAETLSLASSEMRIQLVLRNPLDTKTVNTPGTAVSNLFTGETGLPQPRPVLPRLAARSEPRGREARCQTSGRATPCDGPAHGGGDYRHHPGGNQVQAGRGETIVSSSLTRSLSCFAAVLMLHAQNPADQPAPAPPTAARELYVTVGKSLLVDSPTIIQRVSVAKERSPRPSPPLPAKSSSTAKPPVKPA